MLPAHAGMIPFLTSSSNRIPGAPRVCGDDPDRGPMEDPETECSPRMRG